MWVQVRLGVVWRDERNSRGSGLSRVGRVKVRHIAIHKLPNDVVFHPTIDSQDGALQGTHVSEYH